MRGAAPIEWDGAIFLEPFVSLLLSLSLCIYIHIYVYINIYIYTYVYIYIYACIHIYIYISLSLLLMRVLKKEAAPGGNPQLSVSLLFVLKVSIPLISPGTGC